ncbi:MAG: hypothetical protein ABIK98_02455 [Pseudomonadota bacterium]
MLGAILGAVSPAVVVPLMIEFMDRGREGPCFTAIARKIQRLRNTGKFCMTGDTFFVPFLDGHILS